MKTILAFAFAFLALDGHAEEKYAKGLRAPFGWKEHSAFHKVTRENVVLPPRFNIVDKIGKPLPVKNQGNCGSCWDFGTSSSVELSYYWRDGEYIEVSPQDGLSCSGAGSCQGGYFDALTYFMNHGIGVESAWPYRAKDLPCKPIAPKLQIQSWAYIGTPGRTPQIDEIKQVLVTGKAVAATVAADMRFENYEPGNYKGGLFTGSRRPGPVNHIVTIVGYDEKGWDVLNSWGPAWGDKGHIHMKFGANRIGETATVIYLLP